MKLEFTSIEELKDFATKVLGLGEAAPAAPVQPVTPTESTVGMPAPAPTAVKTYTRDELINASMPLVDTHLEALQGLMTKYSITNINDLPENQFGAFAADIRALGGTI